MARRGFDMDDIPSSTRGENRKRPTDLIDIFQLGTKPARLRPLPGGVFLYAGHWVKTVTKEGKQTQFYAQCSAFDTETGKLAGGDGTGHCPWCELNKAYEGAARLSKEGYLNAMNMVSLKKLEGKIPRPSPEEKEAGYKIKDSETDTPIVALRLPMGVLGDIKKLKEQNRSGDEDEDGEISGQSYTVSDPEHGAIISITKDKDAPAAKMYSVLLSKRNHTIPPEWKKYLRWDLSELQDPMDEEEARSEFQKFIKRVGADLGYDEFLEGDSKKSKSKRHEDDEDDDLDDDETPKRKAKRSVEEDDDEDFEEPKAKSKKRAVEEDDDFDDEDDEPAPKSKKKAPVEDDDFDDEDDEPAPKRKAKAKPVEDDEDDEPAPPKRKAKRVVDEDDDL